MLYSVASLMACDAAYFCLLVEKNVVHFQAIMHKTRPSGSPFYAFPFYSEEYPHPSTNHLRDFYPKYDYGSMCMGMQV